MDLYTGFRVDAYKDSLAQYGEQDSRTWAVSVDPADGTFFDQNPTTLSNVPTVQDQVLYLAKNVADTLLTDAAPDVQADNVTLFAYGGHVMVPQRTDILNWIGNANSNVYAFVIPYAYTNDYTEPVRRPVYS